MQADYRDTALHREAQALFRAIYQPGTGQISDAMDVNVSPDGRKAVFAGTFVQALEGSMPTRVGQVDLDSGSLRVLTFGPNTDRLPKYSPDGRCIAFLSDRRRAGDFQLYLLDPVSGAARPAPVVDGWVEYLHWSPDGTQVLLGVAGHGAQTSGAQGAALSSQDAEAMPAWMPAVETGSESYRWRHVWVYELATDTVRKVGAAQLNVWEAAWCGNDEIVAVASLGPGEGLWYSARLHLIETGHGDHGSELYRPQDQLGWLAASPSGEYVAVVEGVSSDRWFVAGDLRLIATGSGHVRRVDTHGVDITCVEWRSDRHLLLAGHRGLETVVGLYDVASGIFNEVWASRELAAGAAYVAVSGLGDAGDCVLVGEGFGRAPEIAVIRRGEYHVVRSFDLGYADEVKALEGWESLSWLAPDGLEIQGWLLRPKGRAPHPMVMQLHGGPVWHWRALWLGRRLPLLMLIQRGYAVFLPNPRGSSGRGQDFAKRVVGDMGGADTHDCLSGLDRLVERGIADPGRLGVTGVSYGGFMSAWLVTQDSRFAAAVPVAPTANHVSKHLTTTIPQFVASFLRDRYDNPAGRYFERSPIMHAHRVKTPTLQICGALDRSSPPSEAVQFHHALLEHGVKSVLVTYPQEGHGIRKLPAVIDYAARMVGWFEEHLR